MKRSTAILFVGLFLSLGVVYAWARLRAEMPWLQTEIVEVSEPPETHLVTPAMLAATEKMAKLPAPAFDAEATDGASYRLEDTLGKRPLVLVFIKDGCPCSRAAEPFFNRLHAAYKDEVQFLGVIDVDMTTAKTWATVNRVPFPVLADPEFQIIHAYKAESSAYVALVSKDGTIETLWPGYSGSMLTEASEALARLSGREVKSINATDGPTVLTTGCSFE